MSVSPLSILHTEASAGWGGQEIRILTEAAGLRERGHQVALLCKPGSTIAERADAFRIEVLLDAMPFALDPRTIARMAAAFRRFRPQLIVTHSSVDSWCAGTAARLLRVPIARVRHLSVPVGPNPATRFVYRALCDAVITTGVTIRAHLVEDLGLSEAKVQSIPTGIDLARFDLRKADGPQIRREFGIPSEAPLIGIVATLRDWKGHRDFLHAVAAIRNRLPDLRALIVGGGPQRHNIVRWIAELNLGDAVILTGQREDVPDILASLDVLVSASTGAEGVPQVLLQALAMERPVVATDVGSVAEIIKDGETGLLVPPKNSGRLAEAIEVALADVRVQRWAVTGAEQVRMRWGLPRMLDDLEAVYARLAAPAW